MSLVGKGEAGRIIAWLRFTGPDGESVIKVKAGDSVRVVSRLNAIGEVISDVYLNDEVWTEMDPKVEVSLLTPAMTNAFFAFLRL